VVAVDIPSGLTSDASPRRICSRGLHCYIHCFEGGSCDASGCDLMGEMETGEIGSPQELLSKLSAGCLWNSGFRHLFAPRPKDSNKGTFGHVLVVAGSRGRTGARGCAGFPRYEWGGSGNGGDGEIGAATDCDARLRS